MIPDRSPRSAIERESDLLPEVVALLSQALEHPERLHDLGQQAALLWWSLDDEQERDGEPTTVEAALLDLAMWHIRDDRLGRQRGDAADLASHLERLHRLTISRPQDE